ncbi:MAG: hypothetical protein A2Y77_11675 [Planctomycetes bacterium RBG_13_62_9]|nr:MAG: hypothetical protein A2Y77_11675 [Planctomycetes bacterium RBG_13_62_9]
MNWLILAAMVAVFTLQIIDRLEYQAAHDSHPPNTGQGALRTTTPPEPAVPQDRQTPREVPGITGELMLRGWSLKGLFGYMWLHANLLHLLGNMWFLWIFGNAVCSKLGNIRYLPLYILLGVFAGVAHLLLSPGSVIGASGAINGIVGMYLFLFYENEITCLFVVWLIVPLYVRSFEISSVWMILFWLLWNVVGVLCGGSGVAYFAHFGGFAAGFGIALLLCQKGWITMERYEKSLLQWWQERRQGENKTSLEMEYVKLGLSMTEPPQPSAPAVVPEPELIPLLEFDPEGTGDRLSADASIRTACRCGRAIRVTEQYAGRTVRCPNCKQGVVIPDKTDLFGPAAPPPEVAERNNYIRFVCRCGKRIKVPARYAGRTGKCPQCGIKLKIPHLST